MAKLAFPARYSVNAFRSDTATPSNNKPDRLASAPLSPLSTLPPEESLARSRASQSRYSQDSEREYARHPSIGEPQHQREPSGRSNSTTGRLNGQETNSVEHQHHHRHHPLSHRQSQDMGPPETLLDGGIPTTSTTSSTSNPPPPPLRPHGRKFPSIGTVFGDTSHHHLSTSRPIDLENLTTLPLPGDAPNPLGILAEATIGLEAPGGTNMSNLPDGQKSSRLTSTDTRPRLAEGTDYYSSSKGQTSPRTLKSEAPHIMQYISPSDAESLFETYWKKIHPYLPVLDRLRSACIDVASRSNYLFNASELRVGPDHGWTVCCAYRILDALSLLRCRPLIQHWTLGQTAFLCAARDDPNTARKNPRRRPSASALLRVELDPSETFRAGHDLASSRYRRAHRHGYQSPPGRSSTRDPARNPKLASQIDRSYLATVLYIGRHVVSPVGETINATRRRIDWQIFDHFEGNLSAGRS